MIPVTVLTGFLGSGKTTLLSRLLSSPELADTAVIVNEFGETDLDHTLITASSENILQLMNGCICCTIREDLALELRNLFYLRAVGDIPRFNRVLIETTGLADPVPIIHTFMANTELKKVYRMQSVVTLVDAVVGERTLIDQDVSRRQVALADQLLISKTELPEVSSSEGLRERLADLNPGASIREVSEFELNDLLADDYYPTKYNATDFERWLAVEQSARDRNHSHNGINTFTLCLEKPMALADLVLFFQDLVNYKPEQLLRVKGLALVAGRESTPAVVHGVREKVYPLTWLPAWPGGRVESRFVFITEGLEKTEIEALFDRVVGGS